MDSNELKDLALSILEFDFEKITHRYIDELPDGFLSVDASSIVGKLEYCLRTIVSAAGAGQAEGVPAKLLNDILISMNAIQSDLSRSLQASHTVPRIFNLEYEMWLSGLLNGPDRVGVAIEGVNLLQNTIDRANAARHDIALFNKKLEQVDDFLEKAVSLKLEIEEIRSQVGVDYKQLSDVVSRSEHSAEMVSSFREAVESAKMNAEEHSEKIVEWSGEVGELCIASQEATNSFKESEEKFEAFLTESVAQYRSNMLRVDDLIQKATGASLFSAFEKKRKQFGLISAGWATLTILSIVGSVFFGKYLVESNPGAGDGLGVLFWLKISTSSLLVLLIGFCSSQYARSKRSEDEYAFKSTLSLSLEPYRDLVNKMKGDDLSESHVLFVIEMIREIYSSPYDLKSSRQKHALDNAVEKKMSQTFFELVKKQVKLDSSD